MIYKKFKGLTLVACLIYAGIFLIIGTGLVNYFSMKSKIEKFNLAYRQALDIAEAGIDYARWRLAHNENDLSQEEREYVLGDVTGKYKITLSEAAPGSPVVKIISEGWILGYEYLKRKIEVLYGPPAYTSYSYLLNSNVWFGGEILRGRVHSNGGIRLDCTPNSLITSAKETYICGYEHGCWPPQEKPGIWGDGGNQDFWKFPTAQIDFNSVTANLKDLKQIAQQKGLFLPFISGGYHLKFKQDSTVDIYKVTRTRTTIAYNGRRWGFFNLDIRSETFYQTYVLKENDLIYSENNLWVEGTVNGRVTVVAARFPQEDRDIIIPNNLVYLSKDGDDVIGLIAQRNVLIPLIVPDNMEIDGVLMAQKGAFRRYYFPWWYSPYDKRDVLTLYGSIISNDIPVTTWVYSSGQLAGGFETVYTIYDFHLVYAPPPYFPYTNEKKILRWDEKLPGE